MTKSEFIAKVKQFPISSKRVEIINKKYKTEIDDTVAKIVSFADNVDFFDEERRALSFQEIFDSQNQINFDFTELGLIPLIDSYDNTYVVYIIAEKKWAKFCTTDKSIFKKKDTFEAIL